jgi:hypothetical protein
MSSEAELIQELDKRLLKVEVKTETQFDFMRTQLACIEETIKNMNQTMQNIRDQFSNYTGAASMKSKIWIIAYSAVTVLATLGLHKYLFKLVGIDL